MSLIKDVLNPSSDDKQPELPEPKSEKPKQIPIESELPLQIVPTDESAEEVDPERSRQIIEGILDEHFSPKDDKAGKRGRYNNLPS